MIMITEIIASSSCSLCGTPCELEPKKVRGTPPAWNSVVSVRFPIRIHPRDAELSYITNGQNVPDDIEIFDTQKIVKNLLGGK